MEEARQLQVEETPVSDAYAASIVREAECRIMQHNLDGAEEEYLRALGAYDRTKRWTDDLLEERRAGLRTAHQRMRAAQRRLDATRDPAELRLLRGE